MYAQGSCVVRRASCVVRRASCVVRRASCVVTIDRQESFVFRTLGVLLPCYGQLEGNLFVDMGVQ